MCAWVYGTGFMSPGLGRLDASVCICCSMGAAPCNVYFTKAVFTRWCLKCQCVTWRFTRARKVCNVEVCNPSYTLKTTSVVLTRVNLVYTCEPFTHFTQPRSTINSVAENVKVQNSSTNHRARFVLQQVLYTRAFTL